MKHSSFTRLISTVLLAFCLTACGTNNENNGSTSADTSTANADTAKKVKRPLSICTYQLSSRQVAELKRAVVLMAPERNLRDSSSFKSGQRSFAVSLRGSAWSQKVINVVFLACDPVVKRRVMKTATEWEHIAHVRFNFNPAPGDTDIAISFSAHAGTWSRVGKFSKSFVPSMNYDDLYPDDDEERYRYYVLHEFGHALGLMHEHQSPNTNVVWNVHELIKYCGAFNPPWDSLMVQQQIIDRFNDELVAATDFDPTSIMMYAFPSYLVASGDVPEYGNTRIAFLDSAHIQTMYPPRR